MDVEKKDPAVELPFGNFRTPDGYFRCLLCFCASSKLPIPNVAKVDNNAVGTGVMEARELIGLCNVRVLYTK